MQQRRGTQDEWNNPVIAASVILQAGEVGLETDTGRFKIGNGTSVWQALPYYLPDNNPSNANIRQGKNLHDVYARLSPLAESYSQTFTGSQVLVPNAADRTPLVVSGLASQTGILQLWRSSAGAELASMDHTGKLTAKGGGIFNGQVNVNNNKIVNLAIPTEPKDAVTKEYVDEIAQGLSVKPAVQAATTENLDGVYDNGVDGVGSTLTLPASATFEIDGWDTWDELDGVLVKNQTDKFENGRYFVSQIGDATTEWILDRCPACDTPEEIPSAYVFVQHGDTYANTGWVAAVEDLATFEVGVDDINWVQFSGTGTFTAGDGLILDGPEFNVVGTANRITANADSIDIASTYVGQTSITTVSNTTGITTGTWNADVIDETKGGTGQSSYVVGDILYADTTTSLSKINPGTATHALLSGGSGAAPLYGQIQTTAITDDAVTYNKLQNLSANYRVLGRISAGAGNAQELTPDQLIETINQGITDIDFDLIPVGATSTTVAQGDHTHTLNQLSDIEIIGTPAVRQVIKYDGAKWTNEIPSGGISVGATPPIDAASGDAWFDSTDGSLYVYYDDGNPARENLCTNPNFESGLTTGWTTQSSASLAVDSTTFYSGTKSLKVTTSTSTGSGVDFTFPTLANQNYTISAKVWVPTGQSLRYRMYPDFGFSPEVVGNSQWQTISYTMSNASTSMTAFFFEPTSASYSFYLDSVLIEKSSSAGTYFDGSTPLATWTGTENLSTSRLGIAGSAQWVQVKANSALEASILTRVSALEARSTDIEAANAVRVADEEDRNSVYPAPVQGNTVFRADLGYEEKYYAAYNATTNPDGTTGTPGWYRYAGGAPLSQNYIINGGFDIWQRGNGPFTAPGYTADRWLYQATTNGTVNIAKDNTLANITGEQEFIGIFLGSENAGLPKLIHRIESFHAQQFSGGVMTLSFYAKSESGSQVLNVRTKHPILDDAYTGFPVVDDWETTSITLTTQLKRYSITNVVPEVLGGYQIEFERNSSTSESSITVIAGVQLEKGPVPTPFRRNQPNIQAELAACQRYFVRFGGTSAFESFASGHATATNRVDALLRLPVVMRMRPSISGTNSLIAYDNVNAALPATVTMADNQSAPHSLWLLAALTGGATQYRTYFIGTNNSTAGFLDISAEL
jgi:hypothetical protein